MSATQTPKSILGNPQFRNLWIAQMVSQIGDRMKDMALMAFAVLVLGSEEGSGRTVSIATIAFTVPMLFLSPFAGVFVDRVDRRRWMVVINIVRSLLTVSFIWAALWNRTIESAYVICGLLGASAALFSPAIVSALPETVHKNDLQRACSFNAATSVLVKLLSIAIAGALVQYLKNVFGWRTSMLVAFAIDAATFLVAAVFISRLTLHAPKARTQSAGGGLRDVLRDFRMGLRIIVSYESVRQLMFLNGVFWATAGAVFAGLMLAKDEYLWSVRQVTFLWLCMGFGMVAGGLLVKSYAKVFRQKVGFPYGISLFIMIVSLLYLSQVQAYAAAWIGLLAMGLGSVSLLAPAEATLQKIIPAAKRGKVFGCLTSFTTACFIVSMMLVNYSVPRIGLQLSILIVAACLTVVSYIVSRRRLQARWDLYWFLVAMIRPLFQVVYHLKVDELENVPRRAGVLVVANHTSYFDALLLSVTFPRQIRWMVTERFYKAWWCHWLFRRMNCICVSEDGDRKAALKAALNCLRNDEVLGLFPEGRLSLDGELSELEPGTSFMAIKTSAPVYVAIIEGAFKAFPKNKRVPRICQISMKYNEQALRFDRSTSRDEVTEVIAEKMHYLQNELRSTATS